jgi:hypothetical protein
MNVLLLLSFTFTTTIKINLYIARFYALAMNLNPISFLVVYSSETAAVLVYGTCLIP